MYGQMLKQTNTSFLRVFEKDVTQGQIGAMCVTSRRALDEALGNDFEVKDVSRSSVPQDFARRDNIHVCFHIRHKTA